MDLYSDILSDLLSGIYSDILSGVLSGNYSDIELRAPDLSRHGPLRSGARGWDPAVQEKEEKDEEEKATLIKSRDPHLAGGELEKAPKRIRLEQPNSLGKTSKP